MTPAEFIKKWKPVALTERAAAHTHFLDLCKLFEHEDPVSADPTGEWFTFEKGATKTGGGEGFADVWKKTYFAWEYKKKKRDLNAAMDQLVRYAAALENPPLQVVCDTDRFIIRTAWTNTVPKQYEIELDDLALPEKREILWAVFHDPEKLRPKETRAGVTKEAADTFSAIATRLQDRGTPIDVAHFVNQLVFCFFANSVKLLPESFFPKLLKRAAERPDRAQHNFNSLFEAMESGGEFDLTDIKHFNGGLFDGRRALALDHGDIALLAAAGNLDWSLIDPTIFGTLFERFLDPDKRAQIGAHYTDPEKIMMIVEPVILRPLLAEWRQVNAAITPITEKASAIIPRSQSPGDRRAADTATRKLRSEAVEIRDKFLDRLANIRILDPACGSGNFLYLALQGIKDLENRVILECEAQGLPPKALAVGPEIVRGIEINPFAAELARTTIWIGDIQWRRRNGIYSEPPPILRKLDAIECRDALITERDDGTFVETMWPATEFIIGNPPFLGAKKMLNDLGESYTQALRLTYEVRVEPFSDLVCWWFEKARVEVERGNAKRVGLVATNKIRNGTSRIVLDKIKGEISIFEAWSDQKWIVEGAAVRVSLVCFGKGSDPPRLDGVVVAGIAPSLNSKHSDTGAAKRLKENLGTSFIGVQLNGDFAIDDDVSRLWNAAPLNPNGKPNSEVLKPLVSGRDIMRDRRLRWVIDFGTEMTDRDAALFERPFEWVFTRVKPERETINRESRKRYWWRFGETMPKMRRSISGLSRYLATSLSAKHRTFIWIEHPTLVDSTCVVIAREDWCTFGVLHSRFHLDWAKRQGNWLGAGNDSRYTPTTTFDTFPFPDGLKPNVAAKEYEGSAPAIAIASAAERIDVLRNAWLSPPDLIKIEPSFVPNYPTRILPKNADAAAILKARTLTNLYNERPQWLVDAHRDLDAAVAAAYGWHADVSEEDARAKLLELNLERGALNGDDVEIALEDDIDEAGAG